MPCPSLPQVWALALSESRLVSAGLDASIVARSFLPAGVVAHEARRLEGCGASEDEGSDAGGSEWEEESEGEEQGSEAGSEAGIDLDSEGASEGEEALLADGSWDSGGEANNV